jgi:hypothetical protein
LKNAAIIGAGNGGMSYEREDTSRPGSGIRNGREIGGQYLAYCHLVTYRPYRTLMEMTGYHLAPPMSTIDYVNSRTPSTTAASSRSGATIPKQTFFAKLKTFGPPHRRDPISSSSEDETSRAPKVSSEPSIFANVVLTVKESSLGSLLVRGDESVKKKAVIGKPRPLMPSLGGYLACDHAEQVDRAAATRNIRSRQETMELALLEVPQSSTP